MEQNKFNLTDPLLKRVSEEFNLVLEKEGDVPVINIPSSRFTPKSIEEEENHFDTFYEKSSGNVYVSQPALPLPFKVKETEEGISILIYPCTEDYGITFRRGPVNLLRNLRFFIMEILDDNLHFSIQSQPYHPLNAK